MVSGCDDPLQFGELIAGIGEEGVEQLLCGGRRVNGVEDVSGEQQRMGLMFVQLQQQPFKEFSVLEVAAVVEERLTKMPVGGVQDG